MEVPAAGQRKVHWVGLVEIKYTCRNLTSRFSLVNRVYKKLDCF